MVLTDQHFQWVHEVFVLDTANTFRPVQRNAAPCRGFRNSSAANSGPKIYVATAGPEIRYVGLATTPMGTRLTRGNSSRKSPRNGYHGYQWLTPPPTGTDLTLHVFSFPHLLSEISPTSTSTLSINDLKHLLERIEAEVVYLTRFSTGLWPTCQNEIHFRNLEAESRKLTQQTANQIWSALEVKFTQ
ncbi:hypothetical protein SAMN02746009_01437 [Hymenobacter psychrotolerans DSM 18569]|uniref:GIY-YIG nuclease family protein n=1 Tax=Hymenobacter psychrotolerans DSM 18569 TaxID=1121959 RepID=A0A1M6UPT1_9BACT|nr:hypothetical protein SAMN02746009_01437 [Hymenobacter psychrotolerans DSM 18569]